MMDGSLDGGGRRSADTDSDAGRARLKLFGGFELTLPDGATARPASRRDAALLAYLASRPEGAARERLSDLLWPDRGEAQARKSLRQALVSARRALGLARAAVEPQRGGRVLLDGALVDCDVREFERCVARGRLEDLERACALRRGEFLDGFDLPSEPFRAWLAAERLRLDDLAAGALAGLVEARLDAGAAAEAVSIAAELTALAPLRESAHRAMMRALAADGRRAEALAWFERMSETLRRELDVRPARETEALARALRGAPSAGGAPPDAEGPQVAIPGLVALPFRAETDGPDDAAIADGLTEEIVRALAGWRWFFVISHLKARTYAGAAPTPSALRAELGVTHVVEGRLRRAGETLTLRLDLSETESGRHVWSGRASFGAVELLEALESLAREVSLAVERALGDAVVLRGARGGPPSLDRLARLVSARRLAERGGREPVARAEALARAVAEAAPDDAAAHATLAWILWIRHGVEGCAPELLECGLAEAEAALEIDPAEPLATMARGGLSMKAMRLETAVRDLRRAIDLNPSFPFSYNVLTCALTRAGRPVDAKDHIAPLDRISPHDPLEGFYHCARSQAHFFAGDDAASLRHSEAALAAHPGWKPSQLFMIAAADRSGDARRRAMALEALRADLPELPLSRLREIYDHANPDQFEMFLTHLERGGAPVLRDQA